MTIKIITTLGPVTETKEALLSLAKAGANIFRFNFTHGTYEWYDALFTRAKEVNNELGGSLLFMLDTKGPEVRTGIIKKEIIIKEGETYSLGGEDTDIPCDYSRLAEKSAVGQLIHIDGGKIQLDVVRVEGEKVFALAENNGVITPKRHLNLPGVHLELPILSEIDKKDVAFGIEHGIHKIAASFVSSAKDIADIRQFVATQTDRKIEIIAKIESVTGIVNIDEIIEACDGIMIARGDLAVETSFEKLPVYQHMIVKRCLAAKKPFIVATQLLASMVTNTTPTRAEASDVGNSVYAGADAIMLSEETSVGEHPFLCVETMRNIANAVEEDMSK